MLDTNAFSNALDSGVAPGTLSGRGRLFINVQRNELQATRCSDRLEKLLAVFAAVDPQEVPMATAVWNVSEWDGAEIGDADGPYAAMLKSLNIRNKGKSKNVKDALITVTALNR